MIGKKVSFWNVASGIVSYLLTVYLNPDESLSNSVALRPFTEHGKTWQILRNLASLLSSVIQQTVSPGRVLWSWPFAWQWRDQMWQLGWGSFPQIPKTQQSRSSVRSNSISHMTTVITEAEIQKGATNTKAFWGDDLPLSRKSPLWNIS